MIKGGDHRFEIRIKENHEHQSHDGDKKNQELHLIFLTRRGHENEGETGSTQVPSRNVALLFCDLQVPPSYRARINNMKACMKQNQYVQALYNFI